MPISYRAEPMISRERELWRRIKAGEVDANNIVVNEEQHHSSWMFGDPQTPILKAYLGDPVRIRLVHAGVKETHVFHLHVYEWHVIPYRRESNTIDAITIGPQTAHTFIPLYGAGNRQMVPGDVIWHCHLYPHFHHGMWGIFRTFNTLQAGIAGAYFHGETGEVLQHDHPLLAPLPAEGFSPALRERRRLLRRLGHYPDLTPIQRLVPLPDREPPPEPTPLQPGFPLWLAGEVCPCGDDSVLRRVLAEDELHFYVSQTGVDDPSNEMGPVAFHCAKVRPLQGFPKLWKPPYSGHEGEEEYGDDWGLSREASMGDPKSCCGS